MTRLAEYTRTWAAQQFGGAHAMEVADLLDGYTRLNSRRKPELLGPETFSLAHYREADRVLEEWSGYLARAERLSKAMPPEQRDAFYQLVLHPIQASANLNDLYVTVAKNRVAAAQGRATTNDLADRARRLFDRDAEISRYYNTTLAGGKWNHMMDQTHIGYTYWQEPPRNMMPRVDFIQVPVPAEMGVAFEGQVPLGVPGVGPPPAGPQRPREPVLPEFDPYNRQSHYIDIYNRGQTPFTYTARADQPWVTISPATGRIEKEQRVMVSIDWDRAPNGKHRVPIRLDGPGGAGFMTGPRVIQALVHNPASPKPQAVTGFVQSNGYVSMEAEHFSRAVGSPPARWQRVPDLGRTLSGMTMLPTTTPSHTPGGNSARLEYRAFLFDTGTVTVKTYVSPTLNYSGSPTGVRYGISIDAEAPQLVNITADSSEAGWGRSVADNIRILSTQHRIERPGEHVLKLWFVDPGVVVQKIVIDAGGERPSYLGPPESYRR